MADRYSGPELYRIDNPINDDYLNYQPRQIAAEVIRSLGSFGWWIHENDEMLRDKPAGFRVTSWVEAVEPQYAHALKVDMPQAIRTKFGGFRIAARLFDIDLENKTISPHTQQLLVATNDTKIFEATSEISESYTTHDMATIIAMLHKMRTAVNFGDYNADVDPRVANCLLDLLAKNDPQ